MLVEDIVVSVRWKLESNLQVFDHHENLDFVAMALWVMTALYTRGCEVSSMRYAMYLARRIIAGMYVGNIPRSALTPSTGVAVCKE